MATKFRNRNYRPFDVVHVTARGLNKQQIFFDPRDTEFILARVRTLLNNCDAAVRPQLLAYGWMDNHLHFLFQLGADPTQLQRIMTVLKHEYSVRFNSQRALSGAVWESPFRARVVRGGADIVNVVTYIHLNPNSTIRMRNSSHAIYLGNQPPGIVSTELVLQAFGGRQAYADFFSDTARIRAARAAATRRINQ